MIKSKTLQEILKQYNLESDQFQILKIFDQTFSDEKISDLSLHFPAFNSVQFSNLQFTDVNLCGAFFNDCSFQDCVFERGGVTEGTFENSTFINCSMKHCAIVETNFDGVVLNNCNFDGSSLQNNGIESCHFIDTNLSTETIIIATYLENSKFSKLDKSVEFNGIFELMCIVNSTNGIEGMFL
jgi:uncharacterized protein YjbI with pentapeptide repeats